MEGFNRWTVPWTTPELPELDEIRAGNLEPPEFHIEDEQIEAYQRDGVLYLNGAFEDWVEPLRAGLARNLSNPMAFRFPAESTSEGEPGRFFDSYCNWPLIPEYRDFVFRSPAASLAGKVMQGSYAQFFHEHAFVKEAGTQRATPFEASPYLNLLLYPEPVKFKRRNSLDPKLFQYLEGCVRKDEGYTVPHFEANDDKPLLYVSFGSLGSGDTALLKRIIEVVAKLPYRALTAGDTILFSFKTLHGTTDGVMRRRRRAFSTRWLGDDMRYLERAGESSPPFPDPGMSTGDRMREDWFPVLWHR